jgi:hypothetical protein
MRLNLALILDASVFGLADSYFEFWANSGGRLLSH